jgi:hypothetical protein
MVLSEVISSEMEHQLSLPLWQPSAGLPQILPHAGSLAGWSFLAAESSTWRFPVLEELVEVNATDALRSRMVGPVQGSSRGI